MYPGATYPQGKEIKNSMNLLQKIRAELGYEPAPSEVMARVIQLERLIEKMANDKLEALLEKHLAPKPVTPPAQQQQQQQQKPEPAPALPQVATPPAQPEQQGS